jgi:hypothetical protein
MQQKESNGCGSQCTYCYCTHLFQTRPHIVINDPHPVKQAFLDILRIAFPVHHSHTEQVKELFMRVQTRWNCNTFARQVWLQICHFGEHPKNRAFVIHYTKAMFGHFPCEKKGCRGSTSTRLCCDHMQTLQEISHILHQDCANVVFEYIS